MACDFSDELTIGQSIAHNGACMTITTLGNDRYEFFIMEESLSKTSFAAVQPGEFCNIERCLRVGDRLDGHMVTGHIDTTARITHIEEAIDG